MKTTTTISVWTARIISISVNKEFRKLLHAQTHSRTHPLLHSHYHSHALTDFLYIIQTKVKLTCMICCDHHIIKINNFEISWITNVIIKSLRLTVLIGIHLVTRAPKLIECCFQNCIHTFIKIVSKDLSSNDNTQSISCIID